MKLIHFSDHIELRELHQFRCDKSNEPSGALWVSDESAKESWSRFCVEYDYRPAKLVYSHRVQLHENARNLHIGDPRQFDEFENQYGVLNGLTVTRTGPIRCIDWCQVAERYDSVIISPYQPDKAGKAFTDSHNWYTTWEVASGVVLSPNAVKRIMPSVPSYLVFSCEICGEPTCLRRPDGQTWCSRCSEPERLRLLAKDLARRVRNRFNRG